MRILYVVGPFPLLSETFILNQITGLIDRGHEVHVYATRRADVSAPLHKDVRQYDLVGRTRYRPSFNGNRFTRKIGQLQLFCEMSLIRPILMLKALKARREVKRVSPKAIVSDAYTLTDCPAYDIIHCHFGFHGNRAMLLREIGALAGKLVTTFHAVDLTVMLKESGQDLYNRLFKQGDLFLPISQRWRQRLLELGCDETKISVHHMGIDCRRFTFKPRLPSPDGVFRIVSVARLVEKKGLEYGIRAIARLKHACPDIEYTIVGDGPLRGDLELLVEDLRVRDCVRMVGWQEQHQVVGILDRSNVFLAPSITAANGDQEGIPVALMEAMAMGMPVVTSLHSGIPELVADGCSGFLVPEKDLVGLFERLRHLHRKPESWVDMGRRGRQIVEAEYDINGLNDRLVETYRQLRNK